MRLVPHIDEFADCLMSNDVKYRVNKIRQSALSDKQRKNDFRSWSKDQPVYLQRDREDHLRVAHELLPSLPYPPRVTADDVVDAATATLLVDDASYDQYYDLFVHLLVRHASSTLPAVAEPLAVLDGDDDDEQKVREASAAGSDGSDIWWSVSPYFAGTPGIPEDPETRLTAGGKKTGFLVTSGIGALGASERACALMRGQIGRILRTHAQSICVLAVLREAEYVCVVEHDYRKLAVLPTHEDYAALCNTGPAILDHCLASPPNAKAKPAKKIDASIRNAVLLLCEADRQPEPAIALGICWAAIEALIGLSKEKVQESLGRYAATLLEDENRGDAVKYVKKQYDLRCNILHGRHVVARLADVWPARAIAAALLDSVLGYRDCRARMADEGVSRKDLKGELDESHDKTLPGARYGSSVCRLWQPT
jgi:hypothetical protein